MNRTIPESIGKLTMLFSLDLDWNSWEGVLTEAHFQNLTQLKSLWLSTEVSANSTLVLKVKQDWVPPFKMIDLQLTNVRIGPTFPTWLKTQNELNVLVLENAGISDSIPHGLWKSYPNVTDWNLSHNKLRGQVPYFKFQPLVARVDLRSNKLEDLSSNNLSGEIPDNITGITELVIMNLSMNHLTGRIPKKIGNLHKLQSLDLSMNELYGPIPESLSNLTFLSYLNLLFNNLSGKIPTGNQLQTLDDSSIYGGNSLLCGPPLSSKCSKDETNSKVTPNGGNQKGTGVESFSF
ncbi:receptor-like protein EIX2 [Corylus avellana]|uniref:receptor-like protein EIX2 n=1 Tax=Corylus avellana TaxID=13451 RepID=UPI002869FC6D|nr:receptor-like protein EIX2 [Corylus avellana]